MISKIAIVIVTFNRSQFLDALLRSIANLTVKPDFIILIDNASHDKTPQVINEAKQWFTDTVFRPCTLPENVGGSGGFSEGVRQAHALGADWFWLMDDDVEVLSDGLEKLVKWSSRFKCIHGRRFDFDGSEFFWQPIFSEWLALPLPYLKNPFAEKNFFLTNSGCFEGMFIHRDIVNQIGLPDPRFFITWDDAMYGWLASKVTDVAYVNDFVIKRAREQKQVSLGVRHLNDANDTFRFHVVRNRAYIKNYLKSKNSYHFFGFFLGSVLNFSKEIFRMIVVERSLKGLSSLFKGALASRQLAKLKDWAPMPKLPN